MKKILIGTGNPAKFKRYKQVLERFSDLEILSLNDLNKKVLPILEDWETAKENSLKKSKIYAKRTGFPTLSIDEALYIDELPESEQPKTKVRRYESEVNLTDEEMLQKFSSKIAKLSNKWVTWIYAISLSYPNGEVLYQEIQLKEEMKEKPSLSMIPGYPLSSLLFDSKKNKFQSQYTQSDWDKYLDPVYEWIREIVERFFEDDV